MLGRHHTAERGAGGEHVVQERLARHGVMLTHGEVDVAVTGMADAPDAHAVECGKRVARRQVLGDRSAGHDDVDDVVGAHRLRDPERLLSRVEQLGGATVRQHVHIGGAELGRLLGQGEDVLLQAIGAMVFEADDEVASGGAGHVGRDAEVESDVGGHPNERAGIDQLQDERPDATGDDRRHGAGNVVHSLERGEDDRLMIGSG